MAQAIEKLRMVATRSSWAMSEVKKRVSARKWKKMVQILVERARKFEKRESGCRVEGQWVLVSLQKERGVRG
ncbi:hypothetical protein TorRG33x02_311020 [Trema orientale]|uniref:Ribosomal protein n=1 Tax=Trema orientale TaxID=63057 RepID=A0A2P5BRX9_TREOI|nr:hypothetical protein TorRG33x02_311020 [Trema orientale]